MPYASHSPVECETEKMYEHIDLSRIPVFLTVAECMSFTEAAYRLYSTQSSVSKAVASFEAELGFSLFVRQNRSISLTKEGAFLYTRLSNAVEDINSSLREAKTIYEGGSGLLSIGTSGYNAKAMEFEKVCSFFTVQCPSREIELRYMNYTALKRTLLDKKIDAILINDQTAAPLKGYCLLPLFVGEPILAYNPFEPVKQESGELSITDFADRKFICLNPDIIPAYSAYLIAACKAYGFTPNITKNVSSLHEVVLYIGSSNLVTVFDRALFPMKDSDLKMLPIPWKEGMEKPLRSVIVWNPDNENPALLEFIHLASKLLNVQPEII